ncbi:MAG: hypothetical protein ACLFTH_00050 [Candidatus Woesearchaeota archaeon]
MMMVIGGAASAHKNDRSCQHGFYDDYGPEDEVDVTTCLSEEDGELWRGVMVPFSGQSWNHDWYDTGSSDAFTEAIKGKLASTAGTELHKMSGDYPDYNNDGKVNNDCAPQGDHSEDKVKLCGDTHGSDESFIYAGYFYGKPSDFNKLKVGSWNDDNKKISAWGGAALYKVDPLQEKINWSAVKYLEGKKTASGWKDISDTSGASVEGIYFFVVGMEFQGARDTFDRDERGMATAYTGNAKIAHSYLTPELVNANFDPDSVEDYCYAITSNADAWNESLSGEVPQERMCCGDDASDDGYVYGDLVCDVENGWQTDYTAKQYCSGQVTGEKDSDRASDFFKQYDDEKQQTSQDIYEKTSGVDGCCGDDGDAGCFMRYDSCSEVPEGECETYGCDRTGEATGSFSCSDYFQNEESCPSDCTVNTMCVDNDDPDRPCSDSELEGHGCPPGCFEETTGCSGTVECSDYNVGSPYCDWNYDIPACEGEIDETDCSDLNKSACEDEDVCEFSNPWDTDQGYVTEGNKYFCNQDYSVSADRITDSDDASWRWWSAENHNYKIHTYNNVDFISNGQEWFYCNAAAGELPNQGRPMDNYTENANYPTFDYPSEDGSAFTCIDVMNTLYERDFFEVEDFTGFSEAESGESCGPNNGACCEDNPSYDSSDEFDWSGFNSECLTHCKVDGNPIDIEKDNEFCEVYSFVEGCDKEEKDVEYALEDNIRKEACEFDLAGCMQDTLDLERKCAQISPSEDGYEGYSCTNEAPICSSGNYVKTSDVEDGSIASCCLIEERALPLDKDQACLEFGAENENACTEDYSGDWLDVNLGEMDNYACSSGVNQSRCCVAGDWKPLHDGDQLASLTSLAQPEQFVCYPFNGESKIAECCNSYSTCYNAQEDSIYHGRDMQYGYYGKGGTLYTVSNFDQFDSESGEIIDYVRRDLTVTESNPMKLKSLGSGLNLYDSRDWSNFDTLNFDIGYNHNYLENLTLVNSSGATCTIANITDYFTNGNATMRWHHVRIEDLDESCQEQNNKEFWTEVKEMQISVSSSSRTPVTILVDNIYLEKTDDPSYKNRYCAGDFGKWVTNLDGETDEGFSQSSDSKAYGPHWYACESQASYDWTGSRCCGDDTEEFGFNISEQTPGEYFADKKAACFAGVPVHNDMTVGEALGLGEDNAHHNLLYFNGEFHKCQNQPWFSDYNKSYNETSVEGKLFTGYNETFTVIGNHVCSPDGFWVPKDKMPKSRFIASKMYDLTTVEQDSEERYPAYDILCESFEKGVPYNSTQIEALGLDQFNKNHVNDFCTLRYEKSPEEERALIGMSFGGERVEQFLFNMSGHLSMMGVIEEEDREEFSTLCNDIAAESTSSQKFFTPCQTLDNGAGGVRLAYNPDFNILFIANVHDDYVDFNKLFKQENGRILAYVDHIWKQFIGLFDGWFSSNEQDDFANISNVRQDTTYMPGFLNSSVEWTRLYLSKQGDRYIQGLAEDKPTTSGDGVSRFFTVEYENFATSVEFIADEYTDFKEDFEAGYLRGDNKQVISLVNPKAQYQTFQPEFDWRRFTTAFRIDASKGADAISDSRGDGVVKVDELCDYDSETGEDVFKYNRSSCHFWKPEKYDEDAGNVTCNRQTGTLSYSSC